MPIDIAPERVQACAKKFGQAPTGAAIMAVHMNPLGPQVAIEECEERGEKKVADAIRFLLNEAQPVTKAKKKG